jgi:hypothetical protein
MLFAALLQPAAVLIDHGHFQYNNISLGLAVRAQIQHSLYQLPSVPEKYCGHNGGLSNASY